MRALYLVLMISFLGCNKSIKQTDGTEDNKDLTTQEIPLASGNYFSEDASLSISRPGNFILRTNLEVEYAISSTENRNVIKNHRAVCQVHLQGKIGFFNQTDGVKAQTELTVAKLLRASPSRWESTEQSSPQDICQRYIEENLAAKTHLFSYERSESDIWLSVQQFGQKVIGSDKDKIETAAAVPWSLYGSSLFTKADVKIDLTERFFHRVRRGLIPLRFLQTSKKGETPIEFLLNPATSSFTVRNSNCDYTLKVKSSKIQYLNGKSIWSSEAKNLDVQKGPKFSGDRCKEEITTIVNRLQAEQLEFRIHTNPSAFDNRLFALHIEDFGEDFYGH